MGRRPFMRSSASWKSSVSALASTIWPQARSTSRGTSRGTVTSRALPTSSLSSFCSHTRSIWPSPSSSPSPVRPQATMFFVQVGGRRVDGLLVNAGGGVAEQRGHVGRHVDAERFHAAVADRIVESRLVLDHALLDPRHEQLADRDLRLAALGRQAERDRLLREHEGQHGTKRGTGRPAGATEMPSMRLLERHRPQPLGLGRVDPQALGGMNDQPSGRMLDGALGRLAAAADRSRPTCPWASASSPRAGRAATARAGRRVPGPCGPDSRPGGSSSRPPDDANRPRPRNRPWAASQAWRKRPSPCP